MNHSTNTNTYKVFNRPLICAYILFLLATLMIIIKGEHGTETTVFGLLAGAYVFLLRYPEALVALICAVPHLGSFSYRGVTSLVSTLVVIAIVFCWRLFRGVKCFANPPVLLTIVFFIYTIVNLYLSGVEDLEFGMTNLKLYLIRGVAPALLIMTFDQPLRRVRAFYSTTLVFTCMAISMSILAFTGHLKGATGTFGGGRIGLFGFDPISFSLPFGVAGVIAYHHFLNGEKMYTKPLAALFLCAAFVAIIPTGTRQTFLALAAGILIYTYFACPTMIKRVAMSLISCLLIGLALFTVITKVGGKRYDVTAKGYDKEGSFKGRIVSMQKGMDTFSQAPLFGVGSGGHGKFFYSIDPHTGKLNKDKEHIHNLFIELLAEYGLVGFGLYMTSVVLAVKGLLNKLHRAGLDQVSRSNYSLLLGLMGFAVFQANISGGLAVSGGFITMLTAWMSIMPHFGQPREGALP